MGVSTAGQINFGIPFEEGYEFPWDCEEHDGDIDDWWLYKICGYKNPIELYNEKGEYFNGQKPTKEESDLYYDTKREFLKNHPLPVELVNYCSDKCPMYMIAIPKIGMNSSRGYPEEIDLQKLTVTKEDKSKLIEFCEKYCKPAEDSYCEFSKMEPKWYLSGYCG